MKSGVLNRASAATTSGNGPSHIDRDAGGDFILDAALLAHLFGHSIEELKRLTSRGLVSSTVEAGEGEDSGTWRLTLRCGNRMWQAIVNTAGAVLNQESGFTSATPVPPKTQGCGRL